MAPGKTNLDDAVTEACKVLGKPTRAKIRAYVQANFWLTAPNLDVNASINAAVALALKRNKIPSTVQQDLCSESASQR